MSRRTNMFIDSSQAVSPSASFFLRTWYQARCTQVASGGTWGGLPKQTMSPRERYLAASLSQERSTVQSASMKASSSPRALAAPKLRSPEMVRSGCR